MPGFIKIEKLCLVYDFFYVPRKAIALVNKGYAYPAGAVLVVFYSNDPSKKPVVFYKGPFVYLVTNVCRFVIKVQDKQTRYLGNIVGLGDKKNP